MPLTDFVVFPPGEGGLDDRSLEEALGAYEDSQCQPAKIGSGSTSRVDAAQRRSGVQWLACTPGTARLFSHFFTLATVANQHRDWNFEIAGMCPRLQLTKYEASVLGHYDWHLDVGNNDSEYRKISVVALLSQPSDFLGGMFQVMKGRSSETVPLVAGSVVVFPSFLLHRVTPVSVGKRFSLVGWVHGDRPFR